MKTHMFKSSSKKLCGSAGPVRKPASFFSTEEANAETVHGTP